MTVAFRSRRIDTYAVVTLPKVEAESVQVCA